MVSSEQAEVAAKLYSLTDGDKKWPYLTEEQQQPFLNMADKLMKGKAQIFAELTSQYCLFFGMPSKYKGLVSGIISAILGALAAVGAMSQSGCTYAEVTPERTVVCRDGNCLTVESGRITFSQEQPKTDVAPVVQVVPSKN